MVFDAASPLWSRVSLNTPSRALTPEQAESIRRQALAQVLALTPVLIAATVIDVLTLDLIFWSERTQTFLCAWTFAAFGAIALWAFAPNSVREAARRQTSQRQVRALAVMMMTIASIWALPMMVFFTEANEPQRVLLIASAIGIIAGGAIVMAPVWQAALSFQVPILSGGCIVLAGAGEPLYHLLIGLSVVFAAKIYYMVRERGRLIVEGHIASENLREQGEVISLLLKEFEQNASDWLFETDREGALVRCSERLAALIGFRSSELVSFHLLNLIDDGLPEARHARDLIGAAARGCEPVRDLIAPVRVRGEQCWWRVTINPLRDAEGRLSGFRGVGSDVTAARRAEAALERMARFDTLTGLANRSLLQSQLRDAVEAGAALAVLSIDLDRFKSVNDTLGHAIGDKLLRKVADRLSGLLDARDVAARLGGDEFIVLRVGDHGREALTSFADRIITTLTRGYEIDGYRIVVGASVGVAVSGEQNAGCAEHLLRNSDLALYRAKADGKGRSRFFEIEMDEALQARRTLELDLRDALQRNELTVHFQPLVDIDTAQVVGCEALARWKHPMRGMISPAEFIPVAEETGLILPLGEFVLRAVCREAARLRDDVVIAVNLSAMQFRQAGLVDQVRGALEEAGLPANRLELEITESILIDDKETAMRTLTELRALGVRIALDDFGTGYSSLAYLSSFPFDKIKIDRSFVRDVENRPDAAAIIRAISSIASTLGMNTTAEGVETWRELDWLRRHGCHEAQGYLFSRPVTAEALRELLDANLAFTLTPDELRSKAA